MTRRQRDKTTQVAFRLSKSMIERIDAHVRRLREQMPGVEFSRTDAVRALLESTLADVERDGQGR